MTAKHLIAIFLVSVSLEMWAQKEYYDIQKTPFSTAQYDEIAPVFFEGGIVFSSNKKHDILLSYKGAENNLPLNIYVAKRDDSLRWDKAKLFHRYFTSLLHDGPVSFAMDNKLLVYSRNIDAGVKFRDVVNPNNKLGLFVASKTDEEWEKPMPFPYNSNDYSLTTPALDSSGQFMIFASDMPGGFGGSDLYISRRSGEGWLLPVNLGPTINTSSSEAYPFISTVGDLYFSSNGYDGPGGKDILVAKVDGDEWGKPILLKAPINSAFDDLSICTDAYLEQGYISSNRENSDDVFQFKSKFYPFEDCHAQKKDQYCYQFTDDNASELTVPYATYQWVFSDGAIREGVSVEYCFPGPGHYSVKLNMIDEITGNVFLTKSAFEFDIDRHVQPFIETVDVAAVGERIDMNSMQSYLPNTEIERYYWDLGDDTFSNEHSLSHNFYTPGDYAVQLGIVGHDSVGNRMEHCVFKRIGIYKDNQEMVAKRSYPKLFEDLPSQKTIISKHHHKVFDRYTDAYCFGYNYANLRPYAQRELTKRVRAFDFKLITFIDSSFNESSLAMIDTLSDIITDFPEIRLEIALHTDQKSSYEDSGEITLMRANALLKTIKAKGITEGKVILNSYGSSRPMEIYKSTNRFDENLNNRIEFIFLRDFAGN